MAASATCIANRVGCTRSMPVTDLRRRHRLGHREPGLAGDQRLDLRRRSRRTPARSPAAPRPSAPTANPVRRTPTPVRGRPARPRPDTGCRRRRPRATPRSAPAGCWRCTAVRTGRWRTPTRQGVGEIRQRHVVMRAATQSASRPAVRRSSSAEVDDSGNSSGAAPVADPAAAARAACGAAGACSRMACTLVPDIPYDDTAARRGCVRRWSATVCSPAAQRVWCRCGRGHPAGG